MAVIAKRDYCSIYDNTCSGYSLPYGAIAAIVIGVIILLVVASTLRRRRLQRRMMLRRPAPITMQSGSYIPPLNTTPMYPANPAPVYQPAGSTAGSAGVYMSPSGPPPAEFSSPPPYEPGQFQRTKNELPNLVT